MAFPAIPDELLVDIFLRLPTPEDLIRASAACVSFRRLVADRSFLRRFRKLHPPPLLGFVDYRGFHPAVPPHPSAPAASAVASAADFDFEFLPRSSLDWSVREIRDGRVLLDRPCRHDELGSLFKELVVCDPLHRQYLLLPPIPDDLAASAVSQLLIERNKCFAQCFLAPPADDEDAAATEETSFRVIWLLVLQTKPVAAVFSSGTGQWQALSRSESLPAFLLSTWKRMEFSMADHPPLAIVEAGQGRTLMFVPKPDTCGLIYTVWRNNGGSSVQWQMEKTISLDSDSLIRGAVGRHLLVYHVGSSSVKQGCYTRDVDTFQLERVCGSCPHPSEAYCNFPPSLLSSPTVSSGSRSGAATLPGCRRLVVSLRSSNHRGFRLPRPRPLLQRPLKRRPVCHQAASALATGTIPQGTCHADVQGAGDDLLVPELREADPGGVQGPVVAAAAQTPNPLFVVEGTCHADIQGAGEPEVREADPGGLQGPVVAAAAQAPNPLFVIEGTRRADVHGARDDVLAPELREADPGGMQGSVVTASAQAPDPLFVIEGTPHADVVQGVGVDVSVPRPREAGSEGVQGPVVAAAAQAPDLLLVVDNGDDAEAGHGEARGRRRWGWGWTWTCGGCRAG